MYVLNTILCILLHNFAVMVAMNSCESKLTCQECILDPQMCVWCASENITNIRCKPINEDINWCIEGDLQNPRSTNAIIENKDFNSDSGTIIQIRPQRIKLKLRVGEEHKFEFQFLAAKHYPVDLYFLLDASQSMMATKEAVKKQGHEIYKIMRALTNNVYMGLGTFIDKNLMPFVIQSGTITYSFKNELRLTDNVEEFLKSVDSYKLGTNFDGPEGGFDALSQVMACKHEIGWRNESRKIIVFMTDGPYHAAGDAKWAGIFKPHDGKCYVKDKVYSKERDLDYPSLSLINKLASDNEIVLMFISTNRNVAGCYNSLQKAIKGSHHFSLTNNNEIVKKLTDIYKKISKTVGIKTIFLYNKLSKNTEITFKPDCSAGKQNRNENCVLSKGVIDFEATIKVLSYNEVDNFTINLVPEGLKEKVTLDIDILKQCDCERSSELNSLKCFGGGTFECGMCKCNENRHGENCKCKTNESGFSDNQSCVDNTTKLICSGNGECVCGACNCYENYEGPYCNCDKSSCHINIDDNTLCSGHGLCECGTCRCFSGWKNDACDCTTSVDDCIDPISHSVCSDRGKCNCGACECNPTPLWDVRKRTQPHCNIEDCISPYCNSRQCVLLTECALCYYQQKNNTDLCQHKCDNLILAEFVEKITQVSGDWIECKDVRTGIGCHTLFSYKYNGKYVKMMVQLESDCAESFFIFGGLSLGLVIVIGLLTLTGWKCLTHARDRREYEQFKQQYAAALWPETSNPIYAPASTTYSNPTFGRSVS